MLAHKSLPVSSLVDGLDDRRQWALEAVRSVAGESGQPVYLVGGPVRDALLGAPVMDLDFSVEGDAVEFARRLAQSADGAMTVYRRFGTATVVARQVRIDLVTARSETYARPGQLPDVKPGSIADDLERRDFTINAMALPVSGETGGLLDPHGGMGDLESKRIRALHDRSFIDDPTRLFRAVRYEQRFGFHIEEGTLSCMKDAVAGGCMDTVSGDRWRHELERILEERHPGRPLRRAAALGLLAGLHPALVKNDGLARLSARPPGDTHSDDWLAALFAPLSVHEADSVIERLRMAGRAAALARDTIVVRDMEPEIRREGCSPSNLVRMLSPLDAGAVAAWAKLTDNRAVASRLRRFLDELRFVKPALSGDELLAMDVPQGPLMGDILSGLRDARLEGRVNSEDEERALAKALLNDAKLNRV